MYIKLVLALLVGYLLGSVNTAIIVGNMHGVNLRKKGSGNAGLTNARRVLGNQAAAMVLAGDVLKCVIACVVGYLLCDLADGSHLFNTAGLNFGMTLAGISCVVGHVFPAYFQFRGGKGVLTSEVLAFFMDWRIALILLAVFIAIVLLTRYVSLGSVVAGLAFPIISLFFDKEAHFIVYGVFVMLLVLFMHRKNIGRLVNGTEPTIGAKA